ncbi:hypothetical protein K469DRAFT_807666 [Zopfia rhizophila CBS 207.26]|uniref:DUF6594 domain-containing protein n=1 Tax=Zopfia rhizophila CBS 207.26 TaxID=1314779 RepID=A0A6A6DDE9_9PEZI|nr:hypothetical protein K469DRAFT_807666 [Zopfia rhizophila CBS 207.26]
MSPQRTDEEAQRRVGEFELDQLSPLPALGYRKVAQFMAKSNSFAIFRKFSDLNMLNLLSLQAELMELHEEFVDVCNSDDNLSEPNAPSRKFPFSFQELLQSDDPRYFPEGTDRRFHQLIKLQDIRVKLKEYNETLLQVAQVHSLERPHREDISRFREWTMTVKDLTRQTGFLTGAENLTWNDDDDLITVRPKLEKDLFQDFITYRLLNVYNAIFGRHETKRQRDGRTLIIYSESRIAQVSAFVGTITAATLPSVAVLLLYFIKNTVTRLYVLIGLTAAFAIAVKYLASGKTNQVFGATAAFVAVMVVFVGSPTI